MLNITSAAGDARVRIVFVLGQRTTALASAHPAPFFPTATTTTTVTFPNAAPSVLAPTKTEFAPRSGQHPEQPDEGGDDGVGNDRAAAGARQPEPQPAVHYPQRHGAPPRPHVQVRPDRPSPQLLEPRVV